MSEKTKSKVRHFALGALNGSLAYGIVIINDTLNAEMIPPTAGYTIIALCIVGFGLSAVELKKL